MVGDSKQWSENSLMVVCVASHHCYQIAPGLSHVQRKDGAAATANHKSRACSQVAWTPSPLGGWFERRNVYDPLNEICVMPWKPAVQRPLYKSNLHNRLTACKAMHKLKIGGV